MAEIELNFESKYENVTEACKSVFSFLTQNSVDETSGREVELCLAESLNNVIRHSYKHDQTKQIELKVSLVDNKVEIDITDFGESRTNFATPTLDFDPDDIDSLPEGGMGLFIIDQIMDETNYVTEGTTNTFSMKKTFS